jgi:hypothetical protein
MVFSVRVGVAVVAWCYSDAGGMPVEVEEVRNTTGSPR